MTEIRVSDAAWSSLEHLAESRSLPSGAKERALEIAEHLGQYPQMGSPLPHAHHDLRYLLGPWPRMILVYAYSTDEDVVTLIGVEDSRQADAVTARR